MAFNIMGNYKNENEQSLISDLIEESIEQRGALVHYILRDKINPDYLLGEASISSFKEFYEVPMFIESVEHFNGNGDIMDEIGLNYTDSSIFQVGIRKFKTTVCEPSNIVRPREGDLIYLPMADSLWEIGKVKSDIKYHQAGRNYTYRLICKLFSYSHEEIENNTESDFNNLGTSVDLDDNHLRKLLGIRSDNLLDEASILSQESEQIVVPNDNTFGF